MERGCSDMIGYEMWMLPAAVVLTAVGLMTAGYVWGMVLGVKWPQTDDAGDDDE